MDKSLRTCSSAYLSPGMHVCVKFLMCQIHIALLRWKQTPSCAANLLPVRKKQLFEMQIHVRKDSARKPSPGVAMVPAQGTRLAIDADGKRSGERERPFACILLLATYRWSSLCFPSSDRAHDALQLRRMRVTLSVVAHRLFTAVMFLWQMPATSRLNAITM